MTVFPDITLMKDTHKGSDSDWYIVRENAYYSPLDLTIPEGFVTDFSSVPRILWPFIPPHGQAAAASVLHDYIYTKRPLQSRLNIGPKSRVKVERYIADNVFKEVLINNGMKKWQAQIMYLAVRWFGSSRIFRFSDEK